MSYPPKRELRAGTSIDHAPTPRPLRGRGGGGEGALAHERGGSHRMNTPQRDLSLGERKPSPQPLSQRGRGAFHPKHP
jgi:hypothetical protein